MGVSLRAPRRRSDSGSRAIPLGDAGALAGAARRTRIVRLALALCLLGLLGAAAALAPEEKAPPSFVPPDERGVVALDVSASISREIYGRIESALRGLAQSGRRYGLVVFSDTAYVALPPGTDATELDRFADIFDVPSQTGAGVARRPPPNPWTRTFVGGTRISAGLRLAGQALEQSGVGRGAVILVSDLDDDPTDSARLVSAVQALQRANIPLRVIGLNPSSDDARYFEALLGRAGAVRESPAPEEGPDLPAAATSPLSRTTTPVVLLVLAGLFALALAVNEHVGARLRWRNPRREGS
jgi:hypothetical protein